MPTNVIWKLCSTFCELLAKSKIQFIIHSSHFLLPWANYEHNGRMVRMTEINIKDKVQRTNYSTFCTN